MKSDFTSLIIRRAELADAEAITEIYNEAILTTTATFDTEAKEVAERIEWLKLHDDRHPVLVAEFVEAAGAVVGSVENSRRLRLKRRVD